jgi:hypothetical protein
MSGQSADAVVIRAGHNGLVARRCWPMPGWEVLVLEAQAEPGGAVKSAELFPGYVSDLYSAFYPLSVASPVFGALGLEDHGLRWTHAPAVVGHARSAGDEDADSSPSQRHIPCALSAHPPVPGPRRLPPNKHLRRLTPGDPTSRYR